VVPDRALGGLTRRRTSYRSIASLQRDNRVCRACAEAGYPIESLPIVLPYTGQRAYVFGQAPGIQEGQERLPWRGRAGKTLRRWFDMDEDTFYSTFYCASVTRCYPGRAPSGRGDRTPTPREQELCQFWRDWELELMRPELVIPVGGLAARRLLGVKSITECVGVRFERHGYVAIPLPHPSGASSWLNDHANRARVADAVGTIKEELVRLGLL
jgi:uracil-DNA glycosylase